jgi:hypothetical protein
VRHHTVYSVIFFLIKLAVIAVAGGSLCRLAAMQFAKDEKPGLTEALGYGTKRFVNFFTAPLAPLGIVVFIGLFIFLLGLVANIPRIGELIMGICLPLSLVAGALIAVVLIGTVAGFNLMFPAVAYDGSDCFDAISRSFSYVYAKPWRMGFYTAVSLVYGAICYTFARLFVFLMLWAAHRALELGVFVNSGSQIGKLSAIWPEPTFLNLLGNGASAANWAESTAAFLVYLVVLSVIGLLVGYLLSFYFSANTIIYALMRNSVDNTALEDVFTEAPPKPETAEEAEPAEETKPAEEAKPVKKKSGDSSSKGESEQ